jgi:hypothetical protein
MIERVKIKQTLKAGSTIWEEGTILDAPLPEIIKEEVDRKTGTVEVLDQGPNGDGKLIFVAQRVDEPVDKTTSTTMVTAPSEPPPPIKKVKPKPKLNRRKVK